MSAVTSAAPAVTVTGLRRSYGDTLVLDGVDLHVDRGTVFALLGPNGAGKTTMVRIMSTLIRPDAGEVRVLGRDVLTEASAVRAGIGVTGQFSAVDHVFTGRENLWLMADLHHLGRNAARSRVGRLLDQFELAEAADRPAKTYSGGMLRRLDLAMTLMGDPQLIFLDEPTTGLDPRSRRTMWQLIRGLVTRGVTVFLTTQYLEEADQLAGRVAVLDRGKLVAEGTPEQLKRLVPGGHIRLQFADDRELGAAAALVPDAARDPEALALKVPSDGSLRSLRDLIDRLDAEAVDVVSLAIHTPELDDVFLTLTGHPADVTSPPEATP